MDGERFAAWRASVRTSLIFPGRCGIIRIQRAAGRVPAHLSGSTGEGVFKMPVVKRKNMAYVPEAVRISEIVGGSLGEETVYLVPGRGTDYELLFDDNRAWFRLDHVIPCEDGSLCFAIELVEQGAASGRARSTG